MGKKTALQAAMSGEKPVSQLSENQAKSALGDALSKIASRDRQVAVSKETMANTANAVVNVIETNGALFLSSMAEGYFGEDKLKVGSVDVRAPLGIGLQGYGLYQMITGKKGGEHALALGNGVTGSWLSSVGRNAGQMLKQKASGVQATAQVLPAGPTMQGNYQPQLLPPPQVIPHPAMAGHREVLLTPQGHDEPASPNRFLRAHEG
ncbi:MAG: hypothetical protein H6740_29550 [Alphaproteobacteria bacterium]|nr:hypothetical protein [Alphaproteobacteria bacterium]